MNPDKKEKERHFKDMLDYTNPQAGGWTRLQLEKLCREFHNEAYEHGYDCALRQHDKKEKVKARRWTIYDGHTGFPKLVGPAVAYAENVKVIEAEAHDRAILWAEKLAGALEKALPYVQRDLEKAVEDNFGYVGSSNWARVSCNDRDAAEIALKAYRAEFKEQKDE